MRLLDAPLPTINQLSLDPIRDQSANAKKGKASSRLLPPMIHKYMIVSPNWGTLNAKMLFLVISIFISHTVASCNSNRPRKLWRVDGRCGRGFPAPSTFLPAQCDPKSERPCCSDYGYCGNSPSHCFCSACIDFRKITRDEPCVFTKSQEMGYLESPFYPKAYPIGRDCCYDIERPSEEFCGVSLLVEDLDVGRGEERGYCRQDWISLPSCVPERGTRICGNQTGQFFQYIFQPEAKAIRFKFHAGSLNENRKGFKIKYELLRKCSGPFQTQDIQVTGISGTPGAHCYTKITDPRGTINTPYFPNAYPDNLECIYEFVRSNYNVCGIRMQSVRFALENPIDTPFGGACTDFFHLPSCGFLCGAVNFTWVAHFQQGATSMKFHFHSNENNTLEVMNPGFLINFEHETNC